MLRRPLIVLLGISLAAGSVLVPNLGCKPRSRAPVWIQNAPAKSSLGVSTQIAWVIEEKGFQNLLAEQPVAERALDLFLQKAKINPKDETGRINIYVLPSASQTDGSSFSLNRIDSVVLQLDQFRDPKAVLSAIAESFPPEGSLRIQGKDWPLFVVMDVEQNKMKAHVRVASDAQGRVWIGDLSALNRLSKESDEPQKELLAASEWINPQGAFQGFLQPESLLKDFQSKLPESISRELPRGIVSLAWSATPPKEANRPYVFELALSGEPEGIDQVVPWLQRLVAVTNALQDSPQQPPEILKEKTRVGLRCSLTGDQLKEVLSRLGGTKLNLGSPRSGPKA
jgi:hypothetical protein